jgi:type II secretion system protein G
MRLGARGFTLVEMLIVVAVLGIIAAIAAANFFQVWQRARQQATVSNIRAVSIAVASYATDHSVVPQVASGTVAAISPYVTPTYGKHLPTSDAWGNPLFYTAAGAEYTVWSRGADNLDDVVIQYGPTTQFSADIVLANGTFVQWPEGAQR